MQTFRSDPGPTKPESLNGWGHDILIFMKVWGHWSLGTILGANTRSVHMQSPKSLRQMLSHPTAQAWRLRQRVSSHSRSTGSRQARIWVLLHLASNRICHVSQTSFLVEKSKQFLTSSFVKEDCVSKLPMTTVNYQEKLVVWEGFIHWSSCFEPVLWQDMMAGMWGAVQWFTIW